MPKVRNSDSGLISAAVAAPTTAIAIWQLSISAFFTALVVQLVIIVGGWLLLLCRDRQRQLTAAKLVHACNSDQITIVLDTDGRIEVQRSISTGDTNLNKFAAGQVLRRMCHIHGGPSPTTQRILFQTESRT
jgi:hypothetical protein